MVQNIESSGSEQPDPPKKGVNIGQLFGPVGNVSTSLGTIYLYGLRMSDISALLELPEGEPASQIRAFLPCVASQFDTRGLNTKRQPLAFEDVCQLSNQEIEQLADAYSTILLRSPFEIDDGREKPVRQPIEDATTYLVRLLQYKAEQQSARTRAIHEKWQATTNDVFEQVRKSSSELASTLSAYERLNQRASAAEVSIASMSHIHAMNDRFARQTQERAEELEMVRLTGKMTAESAKILKDLAESATVLLEQLDDRDKKADISTRRQINIAVWSVGISAVLALLALIVSGMAYFQDKNGNVEGDKWQAALLAAVREGNQQRAAMEIEIQRLRDKVTGLEAKIIRVEGGKVTSANGKGMASADSLNMARP